MKKKGDATPKGDDEKKRKSPLKWLVILSVVILAVGGGIAGWLFWGGGNRKVGASGEALKAAPETLVESIFGIENLVVTLKDAPDKRSLRMNISLEYVGTDLTDELKNQLPKFKDMIQTILSGKMVADIQGTEGKIGLRRELITRINQALRKGKIRNLYFTEFIIQ